MNYLKNKKILIGITAGAAIYKSLDLVRRLKKNGAEVQVIMTQNSTELISPQLFSAISGNQTQTKMFSQSADPMQHIELQEVDAICVVPATANFVSKVANGIADDLLSTTVLAGKGPLLIAPAMNTEMWKKPQIQINMVKLLGMGVEVCGPVFGDLACDSEGYGRMSEVSEILMHLERLLAPNDLKGKKVLITAGPTRESLDDIRFFSNRSSGRMGYSMAKEAWIRGAEVTLVSGPTSFDDPCDMDVIKIETADEMFAAVKDRFAQCDYFISTAAVADFKPDKVQGKIKKENGLPNVNLQANIDILKWCADVKSEQIIIGFALESEGLLEKTKAKMTEKKCDFMVGNMVESMGGDSTTCLVLGPNSQAEFTGKKGEVAKQVWDMTKL